MTVTSLKPILAAHPFFKALSEPYLDTLTGCASNVVFPEGKYVFRAGEPANQFFLIREGRLAVEIHNPGHQVVIQTVGAGDVLGWSWLFPPYQWHFDVRAVEQTRALAMDGQCLRTKAEADRNLGYEFMTRFAGIMVNRIEAMLLQVADVYR